MWTVRALAPQHHRLYLSLKVAVTARPLQLWRVHRRRLQVRHSGRSDWCDFDRVGLLATLGVRSFINRKHSTRGVWRLGRAADWSARRHRVGSKTTERDGRTAT